MRKTLLILIFLIPLTSALQFHPTSLELNLETNQVFCRTIEFNLETHTTVQDRWANSPETPWSVSQFQTSSQDLGVSTSYPSELPPEQEELEVCISGSIPGEYKGALIFRQEQTGSSVVQFAVWLKLSVSGDALEEPEDQEDSSKSKKSKRSSGSSSSTTWISDQSTKQTQNLQNLGFTTTPDKEINLNSPAPKKSHSQPTISLILIITPIILTIILLLALTRKNT